ncbi:MAG: hypothetical protein KH369_16405 [Paraclostridium bifermentans]|uniref:hypothetical protein n=1 Tax=Paraclostridium bifermentans TaxID=1490 RepID=UPI001D7AA98B|nr:hypothetical protein [Paraclostridium bifermentans]MBS6509785.1 hypothetical protein [Paraclostridium bifermentans]
MGNNTKVYKDIYNKYKGKYSRDKKIQFINLIDHKIRQQKNLVEDLDASKNELNTSLIIAITGMILTLMLALNPTGLITALTVLIGVVYIGIIFLFDSKKAKEDKLYRKEIKKNICELEMIKSIYKHLLVDEDSIVL